MHAAPALGCLIRCAQKARFLVTDRMLMLSAGISLQSLLRWTRSKLSALTRRMLSASGTGLAVGTQSIPR